MRGRFELGSFFRRNPRATQSVPGPLKIGFARPSPAFVSSWVRFFVRGRAAKPAVGRENRVCSSKKCFARPKIVRRREALPRTVKHFLRP